MISPVIRTVFTTPRLAVMGACALALLASACASVPAAPSNLSLPSSAEPFENYDWHFIREGDEVQLLYGVANSDDLPFGLECRAGSGRIDMTSTTEDASVKSITLATSETSQTYRARQEASDMFDGYFLRAQTTVTDSVLASFARLGWMAIHSDGQWFGLAAQSGTRNEGQTFIEACG